MRIVVMGVAGSGKTTVGRELAGRRGCPFVDADTLHPPANVAKMAAGAALTDDDRWPWLDRVGTELARTGDVVVACSALRRSYRDRLRRAGGVRFVFLDVDAGTAHERAAARVGHFMGAGMVAGQFATLERPTPAEADVTVVDGTTPLGNLVDALVAALDGGDTPAHDPQPDTGPP